MNYNANTAKRHVVGTSSATFAAAQTTATALHGSDGPANFCYKAIYANAGPTTLDVFDSIGTVVKVILQAGGYYLSDNLGAKTGGNTSYSAGDILYLFD